MSDVIGIQAARAMLEHSPERVRQVYVQRGRRDARINEIIGLARSHGVRYQAMETAWFRRRVSDGVHQGVVLDCHEQALATEDDLYAAWDDFGPSPLLLILDGVTDPRNFGACLRSANAAGVDAVLVPKRRSAPLSAVALKTAQGGAEGLMIVEVSNLARAMRKLQEHGVWIIGAAGEAVEEYTDMAATRPVALVMGSEGDGMRRLTREHCDQLVRIPMAGNVSSLNVSVAAAVLLFEVRRLRS